MSINCCKKSSAEICDFSFLKVVNAEVNVIQIKEKYILHDLH